ncbi:unnamed protein product [Thelazia callipaeda]|uniref:40S ribosomal protein S24 n=1 Tax=Thelazia callipaeda TaxID=103827 RepID=A0A0N5D916_THECL|nr:unnamed protein product [Thelazia callipaeda]
MVIDDKKARDGRPDPERTDLPVLQKYVESVAEVFIIKSAGRLPDQLKKELEQPTNGVKKSRRMERTDFLRSRSTLSRHRKLSLQLYGKSSGSALEGAGKADKRRTEKSKSARLHDPRTATETRPQERRRKSRNNAMNSVRNLQHRQ